jgi:hypothetical protein
MKNSKKNPKNLIIDYGKQKVVILRRGLKNKWGFKTSITLSTLK